MKSGNVIKSLNEVSQRKLVIPTGGTMGSKPYDLPRFPPYNVATFDCHEIVSIMKGHISDPMVDYYDWGVYEESERLIKDSKQFSSSDISSLAGIIRNNNEHNFIVIPHGTDNVAHNATLLKTELQHHLQTSNKVVAFVCSMVPLSMHNQMQPDGSKLESDALAALSYTFNKVAEQQSGVYVVARDIHTKRLGFSAPETVEKNRFESKAALQFTVHSK
ncbi:MAG: asparaginase domain-containing protein [Rickettsiales bacterium]|nr:asparaginase domain-containing protein [Pseudomonadota bacterium]MDA0966219.1 asparaginase domain-containing protein [Pseudomonadota bacterium]MDG4543116.1 asparaginase domain-containing protein [Rickettsiales bacterium]MDG4545314.1 asparaginase domain-containing protein [Rickettsiales bacterium]MDG4547763.1 asparaginase domain-containing protein [Rickettsiales bacterium]